MSLKICYFGAVRYSWPLDTTSEKKFRAIKSLGEIFVIGYFPKLRPSRFTEHATFFLLPKLPFPLLRYIELFALGLPLAVWLVTRHRIQVLVAQSPYEGFVAAMTKKIVGWLGQTVVLIVESHGDFAESLFMQRQVLFPGFYRFVMQCTAGVAFKYADLFRSVSSFTHRQLQAHSGERPIVRFPAWTDLEVFLNAGSEKDGTYQDILYTGVLIPRKGVHHLIDAFGRLAREFSQSRLVIVGHDDNKTYTSELRNQVEHLGLNERVRFFPSMPQAELARWMSRACVFVLPSISEGLGRVVFEAMASGTPVVGSSVGGIPDMVENGVTGFLVPPADVAALVERIRWIFEHPAEAIVMGNRARLAAEKIFSTDAYVQGYRKLFSMAQDILNNGTENAPSTLQSRN